MPCNVCGYPPAFVSGHMPFFFKKYILIATRFEMNAFLFLFAKN
jgi:hypothetical protein